MFTSPIGMRLSAHLGEFAGGLEERIVPAFGDSGLLSPLAATSEPIAAVAAAPRLAQIDSSQAALFNGLLGGLSGANFSLDVLDYQGLATGDVNLGGLLGGLQTTLGLATPNEALTADVTLGQVLSAAATAARAGQNTTLATLFDSAATSTAALTGTIQLGELLRLDLPADKFADAEVNALDLLTGVVQLFNAENAVTTPTPITVAIPGSGPLAGVTALTLQATVVEPPVLAVGGVGTLFQSAAVRLKLGVTLPNLTLGGLPAIPGLQAGLTKLDLFADVARGSGSITAIDAITSAVKLTATPGVADVYLGTIADATFFDPTRALDPDTDLTAGVIGQVSVTTPVLGLPPLVQSLEITARSVARGGASAASELTFTAPFPATQSISAGTAGAGNFATSLLTNLTVGVRGLLSVGLGAIDVTAPVAAAVSGVLDPLLGALLGGVADPALALVGARLGVLDLAVLGADAPDAASAKPDIALTLTGRPVRVNVLANDLVPLTVNQVVGVATAATNGTAIVNADGTVTYTPAAGFVGTDTFAYSLTDRFGRVSTAAVTVFVGVAPGPNGAPLVLPDVAATPDAAIAITVLGNDTDPDNDALTILGTTAPSHGSIVVNADGTITYTPNAGYLGSDTFTYAAGDGKGGVGVAAVTISVGGTTPTNLAPIANPDTLTIGRNTPATIDVLANDSDPNGTPLTVVSFSQPTHGTLTLNADGTVTYTPDAGFFGVDRFTYTASNGTSFAGSTVTLRVRNSNPTANPDRLEAVQDNPVTGDPRANDTDADGDPLTLIALGTPQHGSVTLNADGTITYTPDAGFIGTDTFRYTVSDGAGGEATGLVTVTVLAGQTTPLPEVPPLVPPPIVPPPVDPPIAGPDLPPVSPPTAGPELPPSPPPEIPTAPPLSPAPLPPPGGPRPGNPNSGDGPRYQPVAQVVGADTTGGPRLKVYDSNGAIRFDFFAYDSDIRTGATAALGDITGDGILDIVTAPGVGGGPRIRVFDGSDLAVIADFFAFEPEFRGGSWVATGDVDGDGVRDIIVGAGLGGGPRVRVFSGRDYSVLMDFFAFDSAQRGGVRVACADFDGDGRADLIISTGQGPQTRVRTFNAINGVTMMDLAPFGDADTGGAFVAGGDVNGDGRPDLLLGSASSPQVRVMDGDGRELTSYRAYESSFNGGVSVGAVDRDGDGRATITTGASAGGGPRYRGAEVRGGREFDEFVFEESFRGGITLG